jgi:V8-like Glu-specific endopeptidase
MWIIPRLRAVAVVGLLTAGACSGEPYLLGADELDATEGALPDSDAITRDGLQEQGHAHNAIESLSDAVRMSGEVPPAAASLPAGAVNDVAGLAQSIVFASQPLSPVVDMTQYLARATVQLAVTWKQGAEPKACTGTLIRPDAVLTAAHCIYNARRGGWPYSIEAAPARSGDTRPYGRTWVARSFVPGAFREYDAISATEPRRYPHDYGVVRLKKRFDAGTLTVGVGSMSLDMSFTLRGYPGVDGHALYDGVHPFKSSDRIRAINSSGVFYHRASTLGGMSGAGVPRGSSVVGVHTSGLDGTNSGVVFSPTTVTVLNKWATWVLQ